MIRVLSVFLLFVAGAFLILNSGVVDISELLNNPEEGFIEETEEVVVEEAIVEIVEEVSRDIKEEVAVVQIDEAVESIVPAEGPIQTTIELPSSSLTEIGTFIWTNNQRAINGVQPLARNSLLDEIAESKLQDMFSNQYFGHEAPNGDFVGEIAGRFGYEYIVIGENLALGDFTDDEMLLEAWMDSPGHRDNILNERFRELGVAVGKGNFKGRETWLAVQSFGTSFSVCPTVSAPLLEDIKNSKEELDDIGETLSVMLVDIESTFPKSGPVYAQKVNNYNLLVGEYNDLLETINSWVRSYNAQIKAFESCVDAI